MPQPGPSRYLAPSADDAAGAAQGVPVGEAENGGMHGGEDGEQGAAGASGFTPPGTGAVPCAILDALCMALGFSSWDFRAWGCYEFALVAIDCHQKALPHPADAMSVVSTTRHQDLTPCE